MKIINKLQRLFTERIGILNHLQIIPLFLAFFLAVGSVGSLGYIYCNGTDTLLSASTGEKARMSREITETDDYENNVTINKDYFYVDLDARFLTSDGKQLSGPEKENVSRSVVIREPYYNLIGYKCGGTSRYLMDVYREKMVENTYSPFFGIKQKAAPEPVEYVLSIDSGLQEGMYKYLDENNVKGSVFCYDYESGEVLCMVSTPGCSSDVKNRKNLEEGTLMNKNLHTCSPGSTMKIVTLSLLVSQGVDLSSLKYSCSGSVELGGNKYTCTGKHGELDAAGATGFSCNCWFAQAIYENLNIKKAAETLKSFGWMVNKNIDNSIESRMDEVPVKRSSIHLKDKSDFSTVWSLIGETEVGVSPIWMSALAAEIITGKDVSSPRLILKDSGAESGKMDLYKEYFKPVSDIWKRGYSTIYEGYSEHLTAAKTGTYEKENENGGKDISKTLMGVSEDLHVAFYISMENYRKDGVQLPIVQRDIANELLAGIAKMNPARESE